MGTVIDVGYSQGTFDWDAAASQIDGAILEMGYGSDYSSQDDCQFERNVAECNRLGIPWGAYLYSYASSDDAASSEADHALRQLSGKNPKLPVYLDVEESSLDWFSHRACEVFCARLQKAGYIAGYYTGRSYGNSMGLGDLPYTSWIAEYGSDQCNYNWPVDAWQYTNSGVMGVDTSIFYREFGGSDRPQAKSKRKKTHMECIIVNAMGTGVAYYFDGHDLHDLTHPDDIGILNTIHNACYGADIPCLQIDCFDADGACTAPWSARLRQVVQGGDPLPVVPGMDGFPPRCQR